MTLKNKPGSFGIIEKLRIFLKHESEPKQAQRFTVAHVR